MITRWHRCFIAISRTYGIYNGVERLSLHSENQGYNVTIRFLKCVLWVSSAVIGSAVQAAMVAMVDNASGIGKYFMK